MLVLSRKRGETLCIGNDIIVTVVEVRGDKVRLGIEAPTSVPVHRKEVFDAIQRQTAATPTPKAPLASFLPEKGSGNDGDNGT